MAYLVLARKWRPDTWDKLIAQDHVTATLKNAIEHQRLAHAYLFTGPRGVGKTSAARILAKALNCESGPAVNPCNQCSNCREIADGRSVDVFEIDGASNRGIDEVRNLRENIRYTPAKGKYKIYIIDEVHMLTTEAFNALLKTLEEPPSHVLFVFATTEPHKVPATIVSRCQRFDFRRVRTQDIAGHLKAICEEEGIDVEENALLLIARKADGSMRDSQSILDQMISYTSSAIKAEDVIQALGLIDEELFFEVTDIVQAQNPAGAFHLIDKVFSGGYDLEEFLHGLGEHLRNLLVVRATGDAGLIDKTGNLKKRYQEISQQFQEEDILRMIRIVTETSASIKYVENSRMALEMAMIKMVKLDKTVTLEMLLQRLAQLPSGPSAPSASAVPSDPPSPAVPAGPTPVKPDRSGDDTDNPPAADNPDAGQSAEPASAEPREQTAPAQKTSGPPEGKTPVQVNLETVQLQWEDIVNLVKKKKITVGSFLQEGVPVQVVHNTLEIGFGQSNGFHIDAILRGKNFVTQALHEILGTDLSFKCVKGDFGKTAPSAPVTREEKIAQLRNLGEENEVIRRIVDDFDAEITD